MGNFEFDRYATAWSIYELPTHAYHPNASTLSEKRKPYIAWPKGKVEMPKA